MTADELVSALSSYRRQTEPSTYKDDKRAINIAILRSVPTDELALLLDEIEESPDLSFRLGADLRLARWMLSHPPGRKRGFSGRNEPIRTLLKMFIDKRSGKVSYARERLRERYPYQSSSDQKKIISAMFDGSKDDRSWACRMLGRSWIDGFEDKLRETWEQNPDRNSGYAALKYLPKDYLIGQIDDLFFRGGVDPTHICASLGNEPGFPAELMDDLSPANYLYVMAKLGRKLTDEEAFDLVKKYVLSFCYAPFEIDDIAKYGVYGNTLMSFPEMDRIIWSLGVLGLVGCLRRLDEISYEAHACNSGERGKFSCFLAALFEINRPVVGDKAQVIEEFLRERWVSEGVEEFIRDVGGDLSGCRVIKDSPYDMLDMPEF